MSQEKEEPLSPPGINEETEICFSIILAAVKELGRKVNARFDKLESRLDTSTPVESLKQAERLENEKFS